MPSAFLGTSAIQRTQGTDSSKLRQRGLRLFVLDVNRVSRTFKLAEDVAVYVLQPRYNEPRERIKDVWQTRNVRSLCTKVPVLRSHVNISKTKCFRYTVHVNPLRG